MEDYYPFLTVLNYGTGGYGSYQSLLKLEHELPQARSPKIVLYGFIDQHQVRNVAPGGWLRIMSLYSRRGHVDVPFATIGENNELIRQPPEAYPSWPFRQSSSVITLVERVFMKFKTRKRKSQKIQVTEKILLQMNSISEKYGAKFYMVLLHVTDKTKRHYIKFLNEYNIEFIDCSFDLSDQMIVPGESHPNGKMNALWSQCIKTRLDTQIDTITTSSRHFERNAKNSGVLHDRLRRKQM